MKKKIEDVKFTLGMRVIKDGKYGAVTDVDDNHGYVGLYNKYDGDWSIEMGDEGEIKIPDQTPDLDTLVEGTMVGLLALVKDGWTIGCKALDITPYLEQFRVLKEMQKICNSK